LPIRRATAVLAADESRVYRRFTSCHDRNCRRQGPHRGRVSPADQGARRPDGGGRCAVIVTLAARLRLPALYPSARWPRAAGFPCSISARNRGRWRWHCPSSQSAGRDDCVAGHVRLELRNVGANYPFERSHRFPGIKPNSGHRDYSRFELRRWGDAARPAGISAGARSSGASPTLKEFLPIQR